jgi:hypothetical protein
MLAQCPAWQSSGGNDDTSAGSARHAALALSLDLTVTPEQYQISTRDMAESDLESVQWAADYIRTHAPLADYPLHTERTLTLLDDDFKEVMRGTPDVACGPHLFDLKWRERDYSAQLAAYALMLMEESGWHEVHVHVLYGERRRAERFTLTHEGATELVFRIVESTYGTPRPVPCDYCGWCARRITCPALTGPAKHVATRYADADALARVEQWHPSEQTDAAQLATMLFIARAVLKPWIESVEHHALEAVTKQGLALPGYEVKSRAPRQYVADVAGAFSAAGLPQDVFLKCCDVRLNTSPTYPDKVGIVDEFARAAGLKKPAAKRDLMKRLEPVMAAGKPTQYLAEIKGEKGETTHE